MSYKRRRRGRCDQYDAKIEAKARREKPKGWAAAPGDELFRNLKDEEAMKEDLQAVTSAVVGRWKIPERYQHVVPTVLLKLIEDSEAPIDIRLKAATLVARLHGQNQDDEHKRIDKSLPDLHQLDAKIDVAKGVKELLQDPDYLDYQREKAVERDSNAGSLREVGVGGQMANGSSSRLGGSGANGHSNGAE